MLHFHIFFYRCFGLTQKMGRKKIQISRILDQRNRQVGKYSIFTQNYPYKDCEFDLCMFLVSFCMISFILLVKCKIPHSNFIYLKM